MIKSINWKWLHQVPLTPAWRGRLELCLGVVLSGAAVVAMSASVPPNPEKVSLARGVPTGIPTPPDPPKYIPPPPTPTLTNEFVNAVRVGDVRAMAKTHTVGMPVQGMLSMVASTGKKDAVVWLLDHTSASIHDDESSSYGPVLNADAHPEIVALLRERGAAEPTLDAAAAAVAPNAVLRLLAKHPNVNERNSYPLASAAGSGSGTMADKLLIVTKLLEAGADPNRESGATALAGAVSMCDEGRSDPGQCMVMVQMLLDRGARVTGDALANALALDEPRRAEPLDVLLSKPLAKGVTSTALATAFHVDPKDLKRVIAKGIDWAWQDGEEDSALPVMAAVRRGDRELVRALLDVGAPVDVHFKDGSCALAEAIDSAPNNPDQARIVELLVARGANVNKRLPDGRTPLFAAAEGGDLRVVNFLLAKGARVNDLVLDDMPLDIADQNGHQPVARVLHAHGARRARPQYGYGR